MDAVAKKLSIAVIIGLMIVAAVAVTGADAKKHRRLRLTCDDATAEIARTAEQ